jgi:hypothetical protein
MRSTDITFSTLNWIEKNNFLAVPLQYANKALFTKGSVYSSNYTQHDRSLWENNLLNIGILTGPEKNGPIDIDLDCIETIRLAPFFLPATQAIFGHPAKPSSHYLYAIDREAARIWARINQHVNQESYEFSTIKFNDPSPAHILNGQKTTLLELRADKCHTMMPGSVHPEHQTIILWSYPSGNPSITKITIEELISQCKLLAAAALISRHVWLDGQRHETTMQLAGIFYHLQKPLEFAENFISALVSFSGSDDPAHIATVKSTYKKAENNKAIQGARSFLKRFANINPSMARIVLNLLGAEPDMIDELNEQYACVFIGSKHRIAKLAQYENEEIKLIGGEDFKQALANKVIRYHVDPSDPQSKIKTLPAAECWLKSARRNEYNKLEFHPGVSQDKMHPGILNKFTGWKIKPIENLSACFAWRTMLEQYITDPLAPSEAQWLYTFFASILREPMNKQRAAVVIIGEQKIGKSIFVGMFGKILGRYYSSIADAARIYGRFNGHLEQCLLLHSEEAIYSQDKKHRSIIKDLIANKKLSYEEKYLGSWQGDSYTRLIYSTNEDGGAPLEIRDTRHSIFNMKQSKRVPPKPLVDQLYNQYMSEEGPAALMHYLLNYSDYNPSKLQETIANEEKSIALTHVFDATHDFWLECLNSGSLLPIPLRWLQDDSNVDWPSQFSRIAIQTAYKQYVDEARRAPLSSMRFKAQLEKWIDQKLEITKKSYINPYVGDLNIPQYIRNIYSGKHETINNFPSLQECRKQFEKYTGQKFTWPNTILDEQTSTTIEAPSY